jgi:hypothetical protein
LCRVTYRAHRAPVLAIDECQWALLFIG